MALHGIKCRRKPIEVEAFQMTEKRRMDNSEWPAWLNEAWNKWYGEPGALYSVPKKGHGPNGDVLRLHTRVGVSQVSWGDWIIQDPSGDLILCNPDVFKDTYEFVA